MKLTSLIAVLLAGICQIMKYPLNYWFGYYESYTFDKIEYYLCLIEFILIPILFVIWIVAMFKKKHRLWTTVMLTGLLILIGFKQMMPYSGDLIIYGMRDRMMKDYGLETLRHFAIDFDQLPRLPHDLTGPTKGYMNESLIKTGLKEKYPFLNWLKFPGDFQGPSYVDETDGMVDVRWGGALAGHWGFSVSVNSKRIDPPAVSGIKILRVSDDVFFIAEND